MKNIVDVNAMLEALGAEIATPRYICTVDATTQLALAKRIAAEGGKPQIYVPHWSASTVVLSEYNRAGEWQIKCFCASQFDAERLRSEISEAITKARQERERRLREETLPGLRDEEQRRQFAADARARGWNVKVEG